ncbi:hypothetical protein COY28_04075, partial [Candidatus Woesearchaeota archaeon CG_4_10_14_0_2_um_filter_57_5]
MSDLSSPRNKKQEQLKLQQTLLRRVKRRNRQHGWVKPLDTVRLLPGGIARPIVRQMLSLLAAELRLQVVDDAAEAQTATATHSKKPHEVSLLPWIAE